MTLFRISGILFFIIATFFSSCSKNTEPEIIPVFEPTPYEIKIPPGFPTLLNIFEDNPMTVEGIELGRMLFYDTRLAGRAEEGKYMSCYSCHIQENGFVIGLPRPHPIGLDGISTHHAMLPLINLVWTPGSFGWNGSISSIEEDVLGVITDPSEFGSDDEAVEGAIRSIAGYPELFRKAFGTKDISVERIAKAIAQFVRTMISANSKFDRYLRGEIQLSAAELHGYVLFTTEEGADCFHCHGAAGNPLFTTNKFYNNGKDSVFTDPSDRYSITGDNMDIGAYRAPTLRNIEFTAPYMHDGRFNTLDEVIDMYAHHLVWTPYIDPLMHHIASGGNQLTPIEKEDLKAFLITLSDTTFINNPAFAKPDKFPDEF
ncbi:MAG: cytochrome c peroxidase [Bacteroidales bacterium]